VLIEAVEAVEAAEVEEEETIRTSQEKIGTSVIEMQILQNPQVKRLIKRTVKKLKKLPLIIILVATVGRVRKPGTILVARNPSSSLNGAASSLLNLTLSLSRNKNPLAIEAHQTLTTEVECLLQKKRAQIKTNLSLTFTARLDLNKMHLHQVKTNVKN